MKSQNRAIIRVAVAAALSCPLAALAQDQPPPPPEESAQAPAEEVVGLEEIVITAQKRQQSLQDVPLSVSAFSGDMLKDGRMLDVRAIVGFTPGFSGNTEDGFTDALSMRGISTNDFGIGGDPSVAMFVDGFWAGRTGGVMTAMYDIERTEVVKGPQGTLFGRNSIAGAVSVITKKPEPDFGRERGTHAGGLGPCRGERDGQRPAGRPVGAARRRLRPRQQGLPEERPGRRRARLPPDLFRPRLAARATATASTRP